MSEQEQGPSADARVAEIRAKLERGEKLTPEERDYLQSEGIEVPADEGGAPPAV